MGALAQLGDNLAVGFGAALAPVNLLLGGIGVTLGTAVGVLPGVGPALGSRGQLPFSVLQASRRLRSRWRRHLLLTDGAWFTRSKAQA